MTTPIITTSLQNLLSAIRDATGRTAITNALNNDSTLLNTFNNLAAGANCAAKLTKIDYNPDVMDTTGSFRRNSDGTNTNVLHMGFGWISKPVSFIDPTPTIDTDKLAYLMGHEGGHDADANNLEAADTNFETHVQLISESSGTEPHDYTETISTYQHAYLRSEGKADIAGWNAAVQNKSNELGRSLNPTELGDLSSKFNTSFYDSDGILKPGFTEADPTNPGQIATTETNVANATANYLTRTPSLNNGTLVTYPEFRGLAALLGSIVTAENGKTISVNYDTIGFNVDPSNSNNTLSAAAVNNLMISSGLLIDGADRQFTINNTADKSACTFTFQGSQVSSAMTSVTGSTVTTDQRTYSVNQTTKTVTLTSDHVEHYANGALTDKNSMAITADGKSVTTSADNNGDGKIDVANTLIYTDSTRSTLSSDSRATYDNTAGTVTTSTLNYNPTGNTCTFNTKVNSIYGAGILFNEINGIETISGNTKSITSANISGTGVTITADNATLTLAAGASATVNGYADNITVAAAATLNVNGTANVQVSSGVYSVTGKSVISASSDGRSASINVDSNNDGVADKRVNFQTFDDGSTLTTTKYTNGRETITSTDVDKNVKQVDYSILNDPNIQTITLRNAAGDITSTSSITQTVDSNPSNAAYGQIIANTYDIVNKDSAGRILDTGKRIINPIDQSYIDTLISSATAQHPRGTLTVTSTNAAGVTQVVKNALSLSNLDIAATGFNDAYAIYKAFQSGNLASLSQGALTSINDYSTITTTRGLPEISLAANGLGAIMGLQGMNNAWQQGDGLAFASSAGNTVIAGASVYASSMGYASRIIGKVAADGTVTTTTQTGLQAALDDKVKNVFGDATSSISAISEAMPYLSIAVDLEHGNVAGAVGESVGLYLMNIGEVSGPVGAVIGLVLGMVLGDLFGGSDSPPPPWGSASAVWDPASGTIRINAVGISGGDAAAGSALTSLEGSLDNLTQQYNSQTQADFRIGLIPQRLGDISYNSLGYRISSIDPATGSSLNANLHFSASTGQSINADINDPVYFQSMGQYYINNALARQAIAPEWEVQTAQQQDAHNLSNAGLSEVERAADLGHLATALPVDATTESWNPIGIDLGGGLATSSLASSSVQFNVDGTANLDARITGTSSAQYLKHTAWLNRQDGFLVLDKNLNGSIDNAEELFSNSQVNTQSRGNASLATWDGDGNGAINASDAVFSQLAVWQDANGDGQVEQSEYHHLKELGITGLNYKLGTYAKTDGSLHQMGTLTLQAQTTGHAYTAKTDGIQIDSSTGQAQLLVTQVHDLSSVQANEDGFATDENVPAVIQLRGNGSTVQGLLDNDQVSNAPNALLNVIGVQNEQNGTVSLDANEGTVTFTPNEGFYGAAGFDYTVNAGAYGQTTAHVQVTVAPNDQAPHITGEQNTQIPIYGYDYDLAPLYQPGYGYGNPGGFVMGSNLNSYNYRSVPVGYETDGNSGVVNVTDVDDPVSALTWSVVAQAHYGTASIDNSGHWAFSAGANTGGGFFVVPVTNDAFMVQVKDPSGKTDTLAITVPLPPPPAGTGGDNGGGGGDVGIGVGDSGGDGGSGGGDGGEPVILDLNGTGFHFTSVSESNVFLQSASDGLRHRTAWFSGGNGVLAFDKYNDGIVHDSSQIAFKDYLPTAQTDLQGLAAFDSNHDGMINQSDTLWSKLGAWVDTNQDGICETGEFKTLDGLGIASISLTSNNQFRVNQGVTVYGETTFTRTDGTTGRAADTVLPMSSDVLAINANGGIQVTALAVNADGSTHVTPVAINADGPPQVTRVAQANPANPITVGDGNNLVLGEKGDNVITAGNGNNVISTGAGNDLIQAGNGNNTIMSGDGNDLIVAGNGDNAIMLSAGPKTVVIGMGNNLVTGGTGNNIMMAGDGNNTLYAGSGNSVVYAGNGDNSMVGGSGHNELVAGNGNNLFTDGGGRTDMTAGTGSNTFVVTNTQDTITVAPAQGTVQGSNTVKAAVNWTLGANQQILWGTGSAALTLKGNDQGNQIIGNGAADILIGGTGNDTLADSAGAATLIGGQGDDTYIVSNAAAVVTEAAGEGMDTVLSHVSYALNANIENLTLVGINAVNGTGNTQNNVLVGNAGNNSLVGGMGNDTLDGSTGIDTAVYAGNRADYSITRNPGAGGFQVTALSGTDGSDFVKNVELLRFADSTTVLASLASDAGIVDHFDGLKYIASYSDLIRAFGANEAAGVTHFVNAGYAEGRTASFNAAQYLANYTDLTAAFGANQTAAEVHFINAGYLEGRTDLQLVFSGTAGNDTFSGNAANNSFDGGLGLDTVVYAGNRADYSITRNSGAGGFQVTALSGTDGSDFVKNVELLRFADSTTVLASLASDAGIVDHFDGLKYIASYSDLIRAFGANEAAGVTHFVNAGYAEGRTASFNAAQYLANYTDLTAAFGANQTAAEVHFINAGYLEGRTDLQLAFSGTVGNDALSGNAANNSFDGDLGIDTVAYAGNRADYSIARNPGAGGFQVTALSGTDGSDFVKNVELLRFADSTTVLASLASDAGIVDNFDGLKYIASYGDLIGAFGANGAAGVTHFVNAGYAEGRTASFNAMQYLANYTDLTAAFGANQTAAEVHFISAGYLEGRTDLQLAFSGTAGNDTFSGNAANNSFDGGLGNDTYGLGRGHGADSIIENDATAGNTDVARFDASITTDQLWFSHVGNNLEVSVIGTSDKLDLTNWYLGSQYHVEQFKTSDGKTLLDSQVQNLVSAMAAFAPPAAGQTTLAANYAAALSPVIVANWQ